jgi:hypothetical protein
MASAVRPGRGGSPPPVRTGPRKRGGVRRGLAAMSGWSARGAMEAPRATGAQWGGIMFDAKKPKHCRADGGGRPSRPPSRPDQGGRRRPRKAGGRGAMGPERGSGGGPSAFRGTARPGGPGAASSAISSFIEHFAGLGQVYLWTPSFPIRPPRSVGPAWGPARRPRRADRGGPGVRTAEAPPRLGPIGPGGPGNPRRGAIGQDGPAPNGQAPIAPAPNARPETAFRQSVPRDAAPARQPAPRHGRRAPGPLRFALPGGL